MNQKTLNGGWIAWFVRNPVAANLLMAAILLVGWVTLSDIRTEGFPEPAPSIVTIEISFQGGSPEDVEEGVSIKVEEALNGVEGVFRITSHTTSDGAVISIQAIDGYPISRLKDDVKVRVDAITTFPLEVDKVVITEEQEVRHVVSLQIYGDVDHSSLKEIAKRVRKRLLMLPTVNRVSTEGARQSEINVEVQEEKLREYGLSFNDVARAIDQSSLNLSAGQLKTIEGTVIVQARNQAYFGSALEDIPIRNNTVGGVVRLKNVANVVDGYSDQQILSRFQGLPSINLDVELVGRDSIIDASDAVRELVSKIQHENWLPQDVSLQIWSDEASKVKDSLGLLSKNALMGMVLVLVLLALFLDVRVAFWVAIGIPVSFAGTFIVMGPGFLDYSINDLTIFAFIIVLGIVVDDAIIIAESIYSHKCRSGDDMEVAIRGAKEVAAPATFGVLTTVAAFYPLTTITGNFGGPFRMIAVITITCLLFSLVESKLILPAHLAPIKVKGKGGARRGKIGQIWQNIRNVVEQKLASFVERYYKPMVMLAVRYRYQSLGVFVAVFILAMGLVSGGIVKLAFFADENDNLIYADVKLHAGTPAAETHEIAKFLKDALYKAGDTIQTRYGIENNPVRFSYVSSFSDTEALVSAEIPLGSERPFQSQEFLEVWRESVGQLSGVKELNFYVDYEGSEDLRIEISSSDTLVLEDAVQHLRQLVANYRGLQDVRTNLSDHIPELAIKLKPEAEMLGVTYSDVIRQLRAALYGEETRRIQRGEEEVRVKVRYPKLERDNLNDLQQVRILTGSNATVPLSEVASTNMSLKQSEITRIDGNRVLALTAKIDEEIVSASDLVEVIESEIFPEMLQTFPGIMIELAGESEAEDDVSTKLGAGFVLGLIMIYALLAIPLRSYSEPFVVMIVIPFGIIGAILGHLLMSIPISLLSFFGILALSGVVVNDSLVLVSRYNKMRQEGRSYEEAVVQAGMSRFRAVLLTSITTFFGLFPLTMETSEQAQELIPMAVSLSYGILFATVITLFITPIMLGIHHDIKMGLGRIAKGTLPRLGVDEL